MVTLRLVITPHMLDNIEISGIAVMTIKLFHPLSRKFYKARDTYYSIINKFLNISKLIIYFGICVKSGYKACVMLFG